MVGYEEITPAEVAARLRSGEKVNLIDVREPEEHAIAHVEGARLLPLSRFHEWAASLSRDEEVIVMCHHGIRSAQVCAFLAQQDFKRLRNLAGGIDRWSCEVDASVPRY